MNFAVLCASRCGSGYLANLMENTGYLGSPHEMGGSTPNGVWGLKCSIDKYRTARGFIRFTKHIFMRRKDTLAQALSLYIAEQTKVWHPQKDIHIPKHHKVSFNRTKIMAWRREIHMVNKRIDAMLPDRLEVWYEELCEDPERELRRIGDYFEIELPDNLTVESTFVITRDAVSAEWLKRLR